jgi:hypothetical protein
MRLVFVFFQFLNGGNVVTISTSISISFVCSPAYLHLESSRGISSLSKTSTSIVLSIRLRVCVSGQSVESASVFYLFLTLILIYKSPSRYFVQETKPSIVLSSPTVPSWLIP